MINHNLLPKSMTYDNMQLLNINMPSSNYKGSKQKKNYLNNLNNKLSTKERMKIVPKIFPKKVAQEQKKCTEEQYNYKYNYDDPLDVISTLNFVEKGTSTRNTSGLVYYSNLKCKENSSFYYHETHVQPLHENKKLENKFWAESDDDEDKECPTHVAQGNDGSKKIRGTDQQLDPKKLQRAKKKIDKKNKNRQVEEDEIPVPKRDFDWFAQNPDSIIELKDLGFVKDKEQPIQIPIPKDMEKISEVINSDAHDFLNNNYHISRLEDEIEVLKSRSKSEDRSEMVERLVKAEKELEVYRNNEYMTARQAIVKSIQNRFAPVMVDDMLWYVDYDDLTRYCFVRSLEVSDVFIPGKTSSKGRLNIVFPISQNTKKGKTKIYMREKMIYEVSSVHYNKKARYNTRKVVILLSKALDRKFKNSPILLSDNAYGRTVNTYVAFKRGSCYFDLNQKDVTEMYNGILDDIRHSTRMFNPSDLSDVTMGLGDAVQELKSVIPEIKSTAECVNRTSGAISKMIVPKVNFAEELYRTILDFIKMVPKMVSHPIITMRAFWDVLRLKIYLTFNKGHKFEHLKNEIALRVRNDNKGFYDEIFSFFEGREFYAIHLSEEEDIDEHFVAQVLEIEESLGSKALACIKSKLIGLFKSQKIEEVFCEILPLAFGCALVKVPLVGSILLNTDTGPIKTLGQM